MSPITRPLDPKHLRRALFVAVGLLVLLLVLRLGVRGVLPTALVAVLAPLAVLVPLASFARRHPSFWVVATAMVIGLPALGTSGLVDPWETHYAEVAREMIERRDFLSPWWANEGWFMTKPVLTFWLEAISMAVLGVGTGSDQVLAGVGGAVAHPEWAVRFPGFVLAVLGSLALYDGVARTCGRRAGLFGAIALWTMPGFALLSHQALTDMPLVAGIAASLGLLLRALSTNDTVLVVRGSIHWRGRKISVHAGHAVALVIALVLVPQLIMLATQGKLLAGSPHVCSLPGQPACAAMAMAHPRLSGFLQASIWGIPAMWLVLKAVDETRVARLFALLAWLCAALAAMAKGPAGLVIPAAAVLVHALVKRSARDLLRLEIVAGLALALAMIGPWYLAVYARNGRGFLDELVMRHMLGRTLDHLHDTNDGEDVGILYFVRQLGYATFPWSGIAAFSLASTSDRARRGAARALLFGAALVAFTLVSIMRTKFHHYMLVVLPPVAMLVGLGLDELLSIASKTGTRRRWASGVLLAAAAVTALVGHDLARSPARFILLLSYRYNRAWPGTAVFAKPFAILVTLATLALVIASVTRLRRLALATTAEIAMILAVVLLDVYVPRCGSDGGQRDVLATYYRDRARPSPLVAYQLNWKGENFYTGNHLAIFISSGAPMKSYLDRRREQEDRTVYFVTERGRVSTLRHELGSVRSFLELTGPDISAEFTLVRVTL